MFPIFFPTFSNLLFCWIMKGFLIKFTFHTTTASKLRPRVSEKVWAPLIWFKGCTPKLAFNLWVTNLDRLPTKSRLASWGLDVSTTCSLCSGSFETRDHLFLHCAFTSIIWDKIMIRIGHPAHSFSDWNSILHWAQVQSIASPKTLRLLIIHSLVYLVWRQRNNFIHNQIDLSPTTVFKELDRLIINTITARRHLKNFRHLMALWLH
ncbi:putative reverse transcriptase zinc-binding domain-containing protein [Arabidopsis thaliana]